MAKTPPPYIVDYHDHEAIIAILELVGSPELQAAIDEAKAALVGDSNDKEHAALISLMQALGLGEVPICECDGANWKGKHAHGCPAQAWEGN